MADLEDITFIAEERIVWRFGAAVRLTPMQFAFFDSLLFSHPKLRSRELIYDDVYGSRPENEQPDPKMVDVIICQLRKKLAPIGVTIENVPWTGWKLATVESASASAASVLLKEALLNLKNKAYAAGLDGSIIAEHMAALADAGEIIPVRYESGAYGFRLTEERRP